MERALLIAGNMFRAILHRRIIYLCIVAIGFIVLMALPGIFLSFGNENVRVVMRQRAVVGALDTWSNVCMGLAIFLGATAIGHETSTKTLRTVFVHPVRRWEFLLGKWIGVQSFALLSLAAGLIAAVAVGLYFGAQFDLKTLGLALGQTIAGVAVYSAVAILLSTFTNSIIATGLAFLVLILPGFIPLLTESERTITHASGVVLHCVVPPGYTSHYEEIIHASIPFEALIGRGRGREDRRGDPLDFAPRNTPEINYRAESTDMLLNVGYAAGFLLLGCLIFSYRELR